MATRRLPSLRGMQAFEAAARLGSLTRAATALSITHSAVSHRIRGLEAELGVGLFRRQARGVALTAAGQRYFASLGEAFELLSRASEEIGDAGGSRPLVISMTESIGAKWLIPRLHLFRRSCPEIEVELVTTARAVDLAGGEADVALRYGLGDLPGLKAEPFLAMSAFPVCAPGLAAGQVHRAHPLATVADLARHTLIRADYDDWDAWLGAAGAPGLQPAATLRFSHFTLALAAALEGHGVALGYSGFVGLELAAGYLVRPFALALPSEQTYHLVYLERRLADPRVRAFRDWILSGPEPGGGDADGLSRQS